MGEVDTIFALATPPGRSALAVFRISGPTAVEALARITRGGGVRPRRPSLRSLYAATAEKIDDAVVTVFPGPASFTGEDCVELSVHGSRSVISALNATLARIGGLRVAEPGEFTKRAFLNGRMDLTQAEAVADLIDSETEFQRRQALRMLSGELGACVRAWRERILDVSAEIESSLDFSDEGDVDALDVRRLSSDVNALVADIGRELERSGQSLRLRDGFTVVISGPPNAGKSTLFNLLVGEEAAIVTPVPGTTRDLISRDLDIAGAPIKLIDTAGIRDSSDEIEAIGVARAREARCNADLVIELLPPGATLPAGAVDGAPVLAVHSKTDVEPAPDGALGITRNDPMAIRALKERMAEAALSVVGDGSEGRLIRERHVSSLTEARAALNRVPAHLERGYLELAAEELRAARSAIGALVGITTTEDVLGAIFSRFCIGK
ncbi:MAG: tRNA uridine-5-carboxymethylaminomethyl(34) synthesis GTPase MnmE [Beijerinckiaceae bacterium]